MVVEITSDIHPCIKLAWTFFLSTVAGFKGEADQITVAASCFSWWLALEFQLGFSLVIFQEQGIDTNDYPPGAVSELCDELYEDGGRKEPVNAGCVGMRVFLSQEKHGFSCRCLSANVFFSKEKNPCRCHSTIIGSYGDVSFCSFSLLCAKDSHFDEHWF